MAKRPEPSRGRVFRILVGVLCGFITHSLPAGFAIHVAYHAPEEDVSALLLKSFVSGFAGYIAGFGVWSVPSSGIWDGCARGLRVTAAYWGIVFTAVNLYGAELFIARILQGKAGPELIVDALTSYWRFVAVSSIFGVPFVLATGAIFVPVLALLALVESRRRLRHDGYPSEDEL